MQAVTGVNMCVKFPCQVERAKLEEALWREEALERFTREVSTTHHYDNSAEPIRLARKRQFDAQVPH